MDNEAGVFTVLVLAGAEDGLRQRLADSVIRLNARNQCASPEGAEEAERLLGAQRWDVILWQADGQCLAGLGGLHDLRRQQPDACVVALARDDALGAAARALGAGADGYMPAGAQMDDAFEAVVTSAVANVNERLRSAGEQRQLGAVSERLQVLGDISEEAMFVCRSGGAIVFVNRAAERLTGRVRRDLLGTGLASLFRPGEVVEHAMSAVQRDGEEAGGDADLLTGAGHGSPAAKAVECLARQPGGTYMLVRLTVGAVSGDGQGPGEVVAVARPVVHDEALEKDLAESRGVLDQLFAAVTDAVAMVDKVGVVTRANERMAEVLGFGPPETCVGKALEDLLAQDEGAHGLRDALADGHKRVFNARVRIADRAGATDARIHVMPVWAADGLGLGAVVVIEGQSHTGGPAAAAARSGWRRSSATRCSPWWSWGAGAASRPTRRWTRPT